MPSRKWLLLMLVLAILRQCLHLLKYLCQELTDRQNDFPYAVACSLHCFMTLAKYCKNLLLLKICCYPAHPPQVNVYNFAVIQRSIIIILHCADRVSPHFWSFPINLSKAILFYLVASLIPRVVLEYLWDLLGKTLGVH